MLLSNSNGVDFNRSGYRRGSARLLVTALLGLSIIFPGGLISIKAGIFFLVLVIVSVSMLASRVSLSITLYLFSLFYALVGLAWSSYGEILGNPGAMKVMAVMVAYPILIPLCSHLYREEDNPSLYRLFLVCAWIIVAIDLVYAFAYFSFVGDTLHAILISIYGDVNTDVQSNNSNISIHLMNVNSIIFLLPFFLSYLFFSKSRSQKIYTYLLVLLMVTTGLLANRRAVLLTATLGPIIAFLVTINSSQNQGKLKSSRWRIILFTIALVIWGVLAIDPSTSKYYIDLTLSTFNFTDDYSNGIRVSQFYSLLNGINDAPFWGHGAGAVASIIRSGETPWAYELTYIAFIFHYGVICFVIYAFGVVFLSWQLISSIKNKGRSSFEFYFLSGFISFMLANATNPYLESFDFMWVIFIPYAIVNRRLLLRRQERIELAGAKDIPQQTV